MMTLGPLQTLGTEVVVPAFDPGLVLELCEAEGATITLGVPTMLLALLQHPDLSRRDLSTLRAIVTGGAPVAADLVRRVEVTFGAPLTTVFAQTEASPVITQTGSCDTLEDRTTSGAPLPQTEVKIVDPATDQIVPIGTVGEICARGYQVMHGYFDMPEATAKAIDPEGWLHTGDLGTMDARGYVQVTGRLKDMIIRGGENIYPREIEDVLITHSGVADVAVVGVPDPYWGEQPAAFIRPATEPPPTEEDLLAFTRHHLARYKVPRHWIFIAQFPQTPSGKVQKFVLRERFVQDRAVAVGPDVSIVKEAMEVARAIE
jgi:fatty-acyl-CoA synthase